MSKFNYATTDVNGQREKGTIEAPTKEAALEILRNDKKIVLSLNEDAESRKWLLGRPKMTNQERMMFVKNLSTMFEVGITISESMEIMRDQTKDQSLRKMFEDILDMITSGQTLANSLRRYDNNFSNLFINMIETGEEAGNLEEVLRYLDIQLEKEYEIRRKIVSALVYPAIIISITLMMGIGIVVFIMPKITKIFDSFEVDLPLPTRLLISTSNFLSHNPFLALGAFIGAIAFMVIIFKIKALKPFWDNILIRLPIFGGIITNANIARFSRTINSLLQASVPISRALEITGNMLDNSLYKGALKETAEKVEQGGKIGESLSKNEKLFPSMCTKMIELGEKTGTLETTTAKVADLFEREVDTKTKNLSTAMEPILLVFMAGLVGGIAISIIMPIYQLPNLIQH